MYVQRQAVGLVARLPSTHLAFINTESRLLMDNNNRIKLVSGKATKRRRSSVFF
jgi:hypothetical protein